jgi:hypothetical protein
MRTFAALLTLYSSTLFGQDYLVTTKNDTVRGKLSISTYPTMDKVLVSQQQKKKTEYAAHYVMSIFQDSTYYQTVRVPDAYRIMRIGKSGPVSLCYARQSPGTPYDVPYLVKRTGESIQVTALRFKRTVTNFLNDCARVKEMVDKDELGRKDLDRIVDEYNLCLAQQSPQAFAITENPTLSALSKLNTRLQADSSAPKDAVDILKDIYRKVKDRQEVPNYLLEGLKNSLAGRDDYKGDLEELLKLLNK